MYNYILLVAILYRRTEVIILNKLIVGIDIGKRTHVATIIDDKGNTVTRSFSFENTTTGGNFLLDRIAAINTESSPVVFGLEATGHYWLALYSFLTTKGYSISVINPYQSDAWRKVWIKMKASGYFRLNFI